MIRSNQPLDGFDNKQLKVMAYAMAMTTLFHMDENDMASHLIDAREENTESLDRYRAFEAEESLSEGRQAAEMMDDQLSQMIEQSHKNILSMQRLIRHYGNTLGGIPLKANDAIDGELHAISAAENIVQAHADELWKEATALNEKTSAKLDADHQTKIEQAVSAHKRAANEPALS